jgi:hypothetical protein
MEIIILNFCNCLFNDAIIIDDMYVCNVDERMIYNYKAVDGMKTDSWIRNKWRKHSPVPLKSTTYPRATWTCIESGPPRWEAGD